MTYAVWRRGGVNMQPIRAAWRGVSASPTSIPAAWRDTHTLMTPRRGVAWPHMQPFALGRLLDPTRRPRLPFGASLLAADCSVPFGAPALGGEPPPFPPQPPPRSQKAAGAER